MGNVRYHQSKRSFRAVIPGVMQRARLDLLRRNQNPYRCLCFTCCLYSLCIECMLATLSITSGIDIVRLPYFFRTQLFNKLFYLYLLYTTKFVLFTKYMAHGITDFSQS